MAYDISWNESKVVSHTDGESLCTDFYDNIAVVVGLNKTTGDYYMFKYVGTAPQTGGVPMAVRLRHNMFFDAPGEKAAFIIGCDWARERLASFEKDLVARGVDVISLNPEQVPLESGIRKSHRLELSPKTGKFTVTRSDQHKITFNPFGEIEATSPSLIPHITVMCVFASAASAKDEPLAGRSFTDEERFKSHVDYVKHRSGILSSIAQEPELHQSLKAFFNAPAHEQDNAIVARDSWANNLTRAVEMFAAKNDEVYAAWLELAGDSRISPPIKRQVDLIRQDVKISYEKMRDIARAEGMGTLAGQIDEKLDTIRNKGTRQLT